MLLNRWTLLGIVATVALAGLLSPIELRAAEFRHSETKLTVPADETLKDDLYAAAKHIVIEGTIQGDLVVAGETVTILGTVEGDVYAVGRSITVKGSVKGDLMAAGHGVLIEGQVGDDARIAGEVLKVAGSGTIGGDLLAAGMSLECEPGSDVATDAIYAGMQALLAGKLGRNLVGTMGNCEIDGKIGGNALIYTDDPASIPPQGFSGQPPPFPHPGVEQGFSIGKDAKIGGKLTYHSKAEAAIANPAAITGGVEHVAVVPQAQGPPPPPPTLQGIALARLKTLAAVALVGLATVLLLPRWTNEMAMNLRNPTRFVFSIAGGLFGGIGFGVALVVIVAVTFLVAVIFAYAGLENVAGVSIGLGLFGSISLVGLFWFAVWFLAPTIVCIFLGRLIGRSGAFPTIGAFLIGIVIVGILWSIPHAGYWIALGVSLLGFGAFCVWLIAGPPEEPVAAAAVAK